MERPRFEIADIIRRADLRPTSRYRESLTWPQVKVLNAILRCRTAALGGHRDQCTRCGYQAISYNSCRNRHCPKCQTSAREKWLTARQQELLPVDYYHLVIQAHRGRMASDARHQRSITRTFKGPTSKSVRGLRMDGGNIRPEPRLQNYMEAVAANFWLASS